MMKNMTLRRIADACGGILRIPEGMEYKIDIEAEDIVADSRQAVEGSVFAAIPGERVDGHRFIPDVFAKGALGVICEKEPENFEGCCIKVRSTLQALKDIAEMYLRIVNIPVVGITGSVGKTSTKEMIASVLSTKYNVLKTAGNFNNELGLPLTVFGIRQEHEIAVLEMGISHFGEMHRLAKIARPDVCVITNIGDCHLEFLGDRAGVLKAKTEIFDFLKEDGKIILNGNDAMLAKVTNVEGITPVRFGFVKDGAAPSYYADELEEKGLEGTAFTLHTPAGSIRAQVKVPGEHMVMNALAGAAVGEAFGLDLEMIRSGLEAFTPVAGRFRQIRTDRYTIIDDCYNANPVSMKASLRALGMAGGGRKVAIVGDMAELGPDEVRFHKETGAFAAECGLDLILGAGELTKALLEEAAADNKDLEVHHFADAKALTASLPDLLKDGDTILVKASHCMGFSEIVETLCK